MHVISGNCTGRLFNLCARHFGLTIINCIFNLVTWPLRTHWRKKERGGKGGKREKKRETEKHWKFTLLIYPRFHYIGIVESNFRSSRRNRSGCATARRSHLREIDNIDPRNETGSTSSFSINRPLRGHFRAPLGARAEPRPRRNFFDYQTQSCVLRRFF